jgi:peptidyl-prolyl cis-trans isomerase C
MLEIEPSPAQENSSRIAANALDAADPLSFPDVVARVNDTLIQKEDFLARAAFIQSEMGLPEGDLPVNIYRTMLNEMVDMELLFQASQFRDFRPTSEEIEERYRELVNRFPSEEAFLSQLSLPSITSERFKELMYRDLSVQKLIATDFNPRISVRDEAKLQYYEENKEQLKEPERLKLRHILIRVATGASDEEKAQAREQISELHQKLVRENVNFAEVAGEFSEDPGSKDKGGELVIERGETVPVFEETAFSLDPGSISHVFETRFGFHVIKLCERIPAHVAPFEEIEPMIQGLLEQQALKNVIEDEIKTLREKAYVELFI